MTEATPATELELKRQAVLTSWYQALERAKEAKLLIEQEQALRKEVQALFFTDPKEGTNTEELTAGWKLKFTYKIDRKVDEAALPAVMQRLRDELKVNPDPLINHKPTLDTTAYKTLVQTNPDAAKVFEEALTIKPGSHTLELVPPKKAAPNKVVLENQQ